MQLVPGACGLAFQGRMRNEMVFIRSEGIS